MTSRRTDVAVVIGIVLLVLVSAFAFVGFSAAEHRTNVDQQVSTASVNNASVSVPSEVVLYVVGPESVSNHLETATTTVLEQRGTSVRVVNNLDSVYDAPVLLVGIQESQIAYNPVTPSAESSLSFLYVPSGNVTQFGQSDEDATASFNASLLRQRLLDDDPIRFQMDDENRVFREGRVRLTDSTTGVVSWPAYRSYVIETVAERSVDAVFSDTS
jgi:hypothetical protein